MNLQLNLSEADLSIIERACEGNSYTPQDAVDEVLGEWVAGVERALKVYEAAKSVQP
jgi:hypothetical protein